MLHAVQRNSCSNICLDDPFHDVLDLDVCLGETSHYTTTPATGQQCCKSNYNPLLRCHTWSITCVLHQPNRSNPVVYQQVPHACQNDHNICITRVFTNSGSVDPSQRTITCMLSSKSSQFQQLMSITFSNGHLPCTSFCILAKHI